jgi:hypothetical protein
MQQTGGATPAEKFVFSAFCQNFYPARFLSNTPIVTFAPGHPAAAPVGHHD